MVAGVKLVTETVPLAPLVVVKLPEAVAVAAEGPTPASTLAMVGGLFTAST